MAGIGQIMKMMEEMPPIWIELSFFLCFGLGFLFLRLERFSKSSKKKQVVETPEPDHSKWKADDSMRKAIDTAAATCNSQGVLAAWRACNEQCATTACQLRAVMQALQDLCPKTMIDDMVRHMALHRDMCNVRTAAITLEVVARSGDTEVLMNLWNEMETKLDIPRGMPVYEVLLGGFAAVGNHAKVKELEEEIHSRRIPFSARSYCVVIKGFLKNGLIDQCIDKICEMQSNIPQVPPFVVTQLFRLALEAGRLAEVLEVTVEKGMIIPGEAASLILEECLRRSNGELALQVENNLRGSQAGLSAKSFEALLKIYSTRNDPHAIELFQEMQQLEIRISEPMSIGLLTRCADAKFLKLAEEVFRYWKGKGAMTMPLYSALMKVYAFSGMYDKACDLYDRLKEDGLEPDHTMYGCLMKFAVECGRTQLSQELSEMVPNLDIQNFMSLMRAAGRDRDVARGMNVLARWNDSGVSLDVAAWNCCLDVCIMAGDIKSGRALVEDMRRTVPADIITYNTLMKGYCQISDIHGAKALLTEIEAHGLKPNDVTYNCLINAAVIDGSFEEAWEVIETMHRNNVDLDCYTISIMMKALKKVKNPKQVARALGLIDSTKIDVFSDEILLNTVLDTCIRHHEFGRLDGILTRFLDSGLRPSVHTFASLIKASGCLKRTDQCWKFWIEIEARGLEYNDIVLGCMLNSLVSNGRIDEAVALFRKMKAKLFFNTVIYSTLIKGFATSHRAAEAMETWREMRRDGVQTNVVVYNAVIDAHAREGLMKEVGELVEGLKEDGLEPDYITYSTIVKGYCVSGDIDKALSVFTGLTQSLSSISVIFNTILDGCMRHNRLDLADRLLEDMDKQGVVPSGYTLSLLIKLYGRRRQLPKALAVMQEFPRKYNFSVNAQVMTCLMGVCIHNNSIDKALEVFEEMRALGAPDGKAFSLVILGCIRYGLLDQAIKLVEEAYGIGTRRPWSKGASQQVPIATGLDEEPLQQLLRALTQKGLMESQGVPLMQRLQAVHPTISSDCAEKKHTVASIRERPGHGRTQPRQRRT